MNEDLEWDEELCLTTWEAPMELPEDVVIMFTRKEPMVQELIDRFNLDLEY